MNPITQRLQEIDARLLSSSERFEQWRAAMRPALPEPWHRLVEEIIRAAEEVRCVLGAGLSVGAYEAALRHELSLHGMTVEARAIPMTYKGVELPAQRMELVVNGLVSVEVRIAAELSQVRVEPVLERLRAADLPLGVVINFGVALLRHGVQRSVNRVATAALGLLPPLEVEGGPMQFPGTAC